MTTETPDMLPTGGRAAREGVYRCCSCGESVALAVQGIAPPCHAELRATQWQRQAVLHTRPSGPVRPAEGFCE